MKRFIFCFLAFYLVALGCYAQKGTTAYLDEKKGFKGIVLGDSISKYKDMLVAKNGGYEVSDSTMLHIGGEVKLSLILVKEYKGLVCSIAASAKSNTEQNYLIYSALPMGMLMFKSTNSKKTIFGLLKMLSWIF
jgi:hypothetical protein